MSNFINTPDVIGEEVATARIIEGTVTEYADDRVNSIGKNAFYKRKQLTSVNFPNATTVGGNAFYGCSALTNVELPSWSTVYNGSSYIFQDCTSLKTVSFPSLTATMDYMFYRCASLISVVMSTVTSLAQGTFLGCAGLTTLDFPKVTSIGTNVFKDCSKLTNLVLRSETVASLAYNNAFQNTPFASGGSGGRVFVPRALVESYKAAGQWSSVYNGGACTFCAIEDYTADGTLSGEIDTTRCRVRFFNGDTLLQTIFVPYGQIPAYTGAEPTPEVDYAFVGWSPSLEAVTGDVDYYAQFKFAAAITRAFIGRTIKEYSNETLTTLGYSVFHGCTSLISVNLPNVTTTERHVFSDCEALVSVYIPKLTTVGDSAFNGCRALTVIDIPLVTKIGNNAFENCRALVSMDLQSVTSVGSKAFYTCTKITSFRLPATPPSISTNSFSGINSACIFYIPTGSLVTYQSNSKWSSLTSKYSFVEEDR